ncbi:hypothetical protein WJX74_002843 [Apatococcus lobatus]|uniref:Uncharacterized protein n=2 Tax=Apatococcus TaxID=904362 RepID=A0AAW1S9W8_9CHLO
MASQKRKAAPSERPAKSVGTSRKHQKTSLLQEPAFPSEENLPPGGIDPGLGNMEDDDDFGGVFNNARRPPPIDIKQIKTVVTQRKVHGVKQSQAEARKKKAEEEAAQMRLEVAKEQEELEAQANNIEQDEQDIDAPTMHQVFYPAQANATAAQNENFDGLEHALGEAGLSQADASDLGNEGLRQYLLSGFIQQHCSWSKACSASLLKELFSIMASSLDEQVASAAFWALSSLLGDAQAHEAILGKVLDLPQDSWIYGGGEAAPACKLGWLPGANDFLGALRRLGWREDGSSPPASNTPAAPLTMLISPQKGAKQEKAPPKLHNMQLLWRLLAAICRQTSKGGIPQPCEMFEGDGLQDLFIAALQLYLDPLTSLLAPELENALLAIAEAVPARLWEEYLPGLAGRIGCDEPSEAISMVAGVAGTSSHKRRLAAIQLLPQTSARCKQLRSAAILCLLPTLMVPNTVKGKKGSKVRAKGVSPAWVALPAMPWWDGQDLSRAGKAVIEAGLSSPPVYSLWEVDTALRAAHILVSQMLYAMHLGTLERKDVLEGRKFLKNWRTFLAGMKQKCDRSLACVVIQGSITDMVENALVESISSQDVQ